MAIGGAQTYGIWKKEDTFKGATSDAAKSFGHDFKISSLNAKNNVQKVFGLGNIEAQAQFGKAFEGSVGLEFILADPWIWLLISGNAATTTGVGPYTHTYVDTTLGSPIAPAKTTPSFLLSTGQDLTTDVTRALKGCVAKTLSLDLSVDAAVQCKLDADYATEASGTSLDTNVNPTDDPYVFSYAAIELPTGTVITSRALQSMNITFNRNPELKRGLGNRVAQTYFNKTLGYDVKISLPTSDDTFLEQLYGATSATAPAGSLTEQVGLKLTLDNGGATTAQRQLLLEFVGVLTDEHGTAFNVDEMVAEDLTLSVRQWKKCIAIDNTATQP